MRRVLAALCLLLGLSTVEAQVTTVWTNQAATATSSAIDTGRAQHVNIQITGSSVVGTVAIQRSNDCSTWSSYLTLTDPANEFRTVPSWACTRLVFTRTSGTVTLATIEPVRTGRNGTMVGATSGADGVGGLVPLPAAGDEAKCLLGDGTWGTCGSGGSGDIESVAVTANSPVTGTATCTTGACSFTLGLTGMVIGTNIQAWDADLDAIAGLSSAGLVARTGAGTATVRTLTAPAAGITVSNGDGVSGNPTLALANGLASLEALASAGFVEATSADTYTITGFTGTGSVARAASPTFTGTVSASIISSSSSISASSSVTVGNDLQMNGNGLDLNLSKRLGWCAGAVPCTPDAWFTRISAGVIGFGSSAAAPVAHTLRGASARAGTDTNTAGANVTVSAGTGTGTGATSTYAIQAPIGAASGTSAQTQTDALLIKGAASGGVPSVILAATQSPASGAACNAGTITWDASYIYICTASGAWKRAALTGAY